MKPLRVWAVARKECLHVLRDWRSLAMAIAIPVLLLILYGYALTLDVDNVPLAVWDQSRTDPSRRLVAAFDGSRYFSIRRHVGTYAELQGAIDRREVLLGLVIPTDFAARVDSGRPAAAQLLVDGSDSNVATIAIGYAQSVAAGFSQGLVLAAQRRLGRPPLAVPVELRPRVWYNPDLESRNYIVPGLIAMIMMILAALLTSLTVAREWERGTMEQLISTPIRPAELVLGKLLPYFAIGMLDVVLAVVMGQVLFGVPLRGSVPLLFAVAAVFLVGALSMGMLISILAKNQLVASQAAMILTFVPAFLLSGFVFAIANMPEVIRAVTYFIPARYFVSLMKGIYLKGVGLETLALDAALLAAFAAVVVLLAVVKFKKKLQ
jgi:ABC-2 type transport system permease protein